MIVQLIKLSFNLIWLWVIRHRQTDDPDGGALRRRGPGRQVFGQFYSERSIWASGAENLGQLHNDVVRNVARHPSKTNPSMPPSPTRPPREVGPDPGRKPRGDAAGPHPKYVDDRPVGGAIEGAGFEILESSSGEGAPEPDEAYIRLQVRKEPP